MSSGIIKRPILTDIVTSVITGVERSPFILIEDCYEHSGFSFFKTILRHQIEREKAVELLCFENPPAVYKSVLDVSSKVHDGYTDPLKWDSSSDGNKLYYHSLCDDLQKLCHMKNRIVMIDSLSHLLLNMSLHQVYKMLTLCLKRSNSSLEKIVATIHSDIHQESVLPKFEYLATTVLRLSAESPNNYTVIHKLPSGKIVREARCYAIAEDLTLHTRSIETEFTKHQTVVSDPAADLTFNLNLKDDEKSARNDLTLPYMKSSGEGNIYYHPDEDSEDPDDDLDI